MSHQPGCCGGVITLVHQSGGGGLPPSSAAGGTTLIYRAGCGDMAAVMYFSCFAFCGAALDLYSLVRSWAKMP